MMFRRCFFFVILLYGAAMPNCELFAQDQTPILGDQANKILKLNSDPPKVEIRYSMIGYRDTLIFYTFKEENAVLRVNIDNKSKTFPITAKLYLFDHEIESEGIKKWLNNQHSDALFGDAPMPTATHQIPSNRLKVTGFDYRKTVEESFGVFDEYSVNFRLRSVNHIKGVRLKPFKGQASVMIKKK